MIIFCEKAGSIWLSHEMYDLFSTLDREKSYLPPHVVIKCMLPVEVILFLIFFFFQASTDLALKKIALAFNVSYQFNFL